MSGGDHIIILCHIKKLKRDRRLRNLIVPDIFAPNSLKQIIGEILMMENS